MIRLFSIAGLSGASLLALAAAGAADPQIYDASSVRIDGFAGTLKIMPGDRVTYMVEGPQEELDRISVRTEGTTLIVRQTGQSWLQGGPWVTAVEEHKAVITMTVPTGTPLKGDDLIGRVEIGDIGGRIDLDAIALGGEIGDMAEVEIDAAGSVDLTIGTVSGRLDLDVAGAGTFKVDAANFLSLDVGGAGNVVIGALEAGFDADIAGAGDLKVGRVNGPVEVSVAGAGNVQIASGRADGLVIEMMGAGTFDFDGEAVNPRIEVLGPGEVRISSYSGTLTTNALGGTIKVGDVTVGN